MSAGAIKASNMIAMGNDSNMTMKENLIIDIRVPNSPLLQGAMKGKQMIDPSPHMVLVHKG
jgi:hypothetical protein